MLRRVHATNLKAGKITLDVAASRHARDVLRLSEGTEVEVFDDAGNVGAGTIVSLSPQVIIQIATVHPIAGGRFSLTIASAVPKGERADWMIEKLSELGCSQFIPLATERSVVLPEGRNKRDRWIRIATESAKQSRRAGVMEIGELTHLKTLIAEATGRMFHLSIQAEALPLSTVVPNPLPQALMLLVGPEGGWSNEEILQFVSAKILGVSLTSTVLRVETAAIAAATVVMTIAAQSSTSNQADEP